MGQISDNNAIDLFKDTWGEMHDLVPNDQQLEKDISWSEKGKVGDKFKEDVVLGAETGITYGGSAQNAFRIKPASAGAVKQTEVEPYVSVLSSILPWATISRSLGDKVAFMEATKFITKNNLKSHSQLKEISRWYGQSTGGLGYVSYATATYRGVALTNGGGTINSVAFTAGINAAGKKILFQPGTFAAGHWVGKKGLVVNQIDTSTGLIVASGKLVRAYAQYGYIEVDFTPVAATSATSHKIVLDGWDEAGEMYGIQYILGTTGTVFGINNSQYELFAGNQGTITGKLTLAKLQEKMADAVNCGGLEGAVNAYVNPRTWGTLAATEAGLRVYDKSYTPNNAQNGFQDIEFYTQTGKITVKACRNVKEGDCFVLKPEVWHRSGSAQVGFKVPGINKDLIESLSDQAGFQFRSFSDEYIFTAEPNQNLYLTGINDEAAS